MKKTKVFITLALVFMLLFSYVMPALADEDEELPAEGISAAEDAEKKTVDSTTLQSYEAEVTIETNNNGDVLNLFKIVDVTIGANNELTYKFTDVFKEYIAATEGLTLNIDEYVNKDSKYHTDADELKKLLGGFAKFTKESSKTPDFTTEETDGTGKTTFDVPVGQFVAIGAGNSQEVLIYQTISIEVAPFIENNEYKVYDKYQLNMKTSEANIAKSIYKIAGETPKIEGTDRETANITDTISYRLDIDVPTYPVGATNTTFYVDDEATSGLTFAPDTLVVYGLAENAEENDKEELVGEQIMKITTPEDKNGFFIDFVYDKIKQYSKIIVTYDADLNENATLDKIQGNKNTALLVYSNAPFNGDTVETHPVDENGYATKEKNERVYTYGMRIIKINEEDLLLPGAEFEIYTNEECTGTPVRRDLVTSDTEEDGRGRVDVKGLAAGTYYVKETKAPAGYKLNSTVHEVVLGVDETVDADGYVCLEVVNIAGGTLPSTGGMGTVIFTVVGIILAGGAALLLITKKRMNNNM